MPSTAVHHNRLVLIQGQVKLLTLFSPRPETALRTSAGMATAAQHCHARRFSSSISSPFILSCRFARRDLRSLVPGPSASESSSPVVVPRESGLRLRGGEATGEWEATRASRLPHSLIRAWTPAERRFARERRYGQ